MNAEVVEGLLKAIKAHTRAIEQLGKAVVSLSARIDALEAQPKRPRKRSWWEPLS